MILLNKDKSPPVREVASVTLLTAEANIEYYG